MRRRLSTLIAITMVAASMGYASPAAAVQTDMYDLFTACPTDHPLLQDPDFMYADGGCVASVTQPGSTFRIGDNTTETTNPSVLQWAFGSFDSELGSLPVIEGSTSMTSQPEEAPGGLFGLTDLAPGSEPLLGVQTQVESAGDVSEWLLAPPTTRLKIKLIHPLLGDECYIGSDHDPIVLKPETTEEGTLSFESDPNGFEVFVIRQIGNTVVDDEFSVPEASGCGPLGVLDSLINLELGLPSPSGENEAVFLNDAHIVGASTGAEIQAAFDAAK